MHPFLHTRAMVHLVALDLIDEEVRRAEARRDRRTTRRPPDSREPAAEGNVRRWHLPRLPRVRRA